MKNEKVNRLYEKFVMFEFSGTHFLDKKGMVP